MNPLIEEDIKTYVGLADDIKALEKKVKDLTASKGKIESRILENFSENGISSIKIDGSTVYLHRQLWAGTDRHEDEDDESEEPKIRAIAALRAAGCEDLIKENFNVMTLSAFVRELDQNKEELPAEFEGAIKVAEVFSARVRRS